MKWKTYDVPVPGANEGVDALVQGRADVALHAIDLAKVKEADAAIGVRHLSLDCSPQGKSGFVLPYPVTIPTGSSAARLAPLPRNLRERLRYLLDDA